MKLSIVIPVFNEENTVSRLLERVFNAKIPVDKMEVIVINDGSTDKTLQEIIKTKKVFSAIKVINHKKNLGKGAAVRTGLTHANGDLIIIQDADLEYDPKDIAKLIKIAANRNTIAVYGTRLKRLPNFSRDEKSFQFFIQYMGNKFLSLTTSILFLSWVTDMESGYKLFPKKALNRFNLSANGFEFEPEITAKLLKNGFKIIEVPISTNPRTIREGKKLNAMTDGRKALWTLIKYRFQN